MKFYSVKESELVDIADAIREKTGKTDEMTLAQMSDEISDISQNIEVEEVSTPLNMADGDMVVSLTEGKAMTKVTVQKPTTLVPENIADGVDIAGIIGTLAAGGGGENLKVITKLVTLSDFISNDTVELISAAELTEAGLTFPSNAYCFALMFTPDRSYELNYSNMYVTHVAMCAITNQNISMDNMTSGATGSDYGFFMTHQMQSGGLHYTRRYGLYNNCFTSVPTNGLCYKDGAIKFVAKSSYWLKKTYIVVAGYVEKP